MILRSGPTRTRATTARSSWQVPLALVLLSLIPVLSGTLRLAEVAGGPELMPDNPRIGAFPAPVVTAMAASIVLGFAAIRRRDITAHRAWMIRGYALGLGAGTQAFTEGIGEAIAGTDAGDLTKALSLSAGWAPNAVVAEWALRRSPSARRHHLRPVTARSAVS
jgi:hypothetical protein